MIRTIERFGASISLAVGFRRFALAFAAGAVGALALPPLGFLPAIVAPMTTAVFLIDGCGAGWAHRARCAFGAGWAVGFGYFVVSLYWLGAAFLVEPDKFAWALPLGVLGLPALLAFFPAFGFALAALFWRPGAARVFALAAGLGLSEFARGALFTGFPWNGYGMALAAWTPLAQAASVVGLYGLTLLVVLLGAAPATLADARAHRVRPAALAGVALAALAAFGALRLAGGSVAMTPGVRLRIMQPNLPQDAKFKPAAGQEILRAYLELSDRSTSPATAGLADVTHLIWPESPFPFALNREPQALTTLAAALGGRTTLLTGAIRVDEKNRAYNALAAVDSSGKIVASYDKVHLVPFGEYLPFGGVLRALGLRHFIALPGGFEPGAQRRAMHAPGLPAFQPLVCYEAIFPGEVTPQTPDGERPAFLLNVTNDGWFGRTAGPHQHLAQARLRAVEEGLPLVRAANTGISAVIDPYGRVMNYLPLGQAGVMDSSLPQPIPVTIFGLYGQTVAWMMWAAVAAIALIRRPAV